MEGDRWGGVEGARGWKIYPTLIKWFKFNPFGGGALLNVIK